MATAGAATLLLLLVAIGTEAVNFKNQNYCRNRKPSECCRNQRDDDCSVFIDGSYCYCDDFCLVENDESKKDDTDCCPDFREVCLGEEASKIIYSSVNESAVCYHEGKGLKQGNYTFNCNECFCNNGQMECEEDPCLVDEKLINQMKEKDPRHYGWSVYNYSMFWGWKAKEGLLLRTGTLQPDDKTYQMLPIQLQPDPRRIPSDFDARLKWEGLISNVRDQGWCGASWTFSTLDVVQDRQMILTGRPRVSLAPQELLSCSFSKMGCKGGHIDRAWGYMRKHGAMEERCYKYTSGVSGKVPSCYKNNMFSTCKKYKTEPAYRISNNVQDIQWEIMTNGPVQALMKVHRDLFIYRSGVYQCPVKDDKDTTELHSVRILGWGVDTTRMFSPIDYWLVANSWGTWWGEHGLFRIQRGTNECGIESYVLAVRGRQDLWLKNNRW